MALLLRTIPGELTTRRQTNEAVILRRPQVARQYPSPEDAVLLLRDE